jgi:cellulose biosynthesis protein BcsQ
MMAVAFYNLKGGVGKTTAAVNIAYLAAAAGQRVLLWDLDPQGASSFILRVRPHVGDIRRSAFRGGDTFAEAIKETDYRNLDLLPADFSYRKFDRILDHLGKPARVMRTLLDTLGADYDVVFLDCPAGFSLLTEAVLETADLSLVPTIPTPLSVQTLARILKWADRAGSSSCLAAFFSMVDRRKALHRRACEWSTDHPGSFLDAQIPYASVVEQITVRRTPLPEFAERDPAALAFADLWSEVRLRLEQRRSLRTELTAVLRPALTAIQSLSVELEYALAREQQAGGPTQSIDVRESVTIHSFDTEHRALTESGHVLELHESTAGMAVVAGRVSGAFATDRDRVEVQIDGSWALQILSGEMSPFAVLERRVGRSGPPLVQEMRAMIGKRRLFRTDSRHPSLMLRQQPSKLAFQACR